MTLASENIAPYRDQNMLYQDVWDWDVIVYPDGSIRVLCMASECANGCLHRCHCAERSRMSSPVVDEYKRRLRETPYDGVLDGTARHLLGTTAGSLIPVLSGKHYRLMGPRKHHDGFKNSSIWEIYKEPEEEVEPEGFFQRLWGWMQE